jgi:PhnB protein
MSRPFKPNGVPSLMPYMTVPNAVEAIAFYQEAFQFKLANEPMQKDSQIMHAEMNHGEARIMFAPEGIWEDERQSPQNSKSRSPIALYLYVEDVDKYFEHAQKNGAEVIDPPEDTFWGDRMCRLRDPFGYDWSFATNVKDFDPSKTPF